MKAIHVRFLTVFSVALVLLAALPALAVGEGSRSAVTPSEDDEVLVAFNDSPEDRQRIRDAHATTTERTESTSTLAAAEQLLTQARRSSEPRFASMADALLTRSPLPPTTPERLRHLLLRADILQYQHRFPEALGAFDLALRESPSSARAWMGKAVLYTVVGDFAHARSSCAHLIRITSPLNVMSCAALVNGMTGDAPHSYGLLKSAVDRAAGADDTDVHFAYGILADLAERTGDLDGARRYLITLSERWPMDTFAALQRVDLLLRTGEEREALGILDQPALRNEAGLTRQIIALRTIKDAAARRRALSALNAIRARYRERGQEMHPREAAEIALFVDRDCPRAVSLALENWEQQREPRDVRILARAARCAGDREAAATLRTWLTETKYEDHYLEELL